MRRGTAPGKFVGLVQVSVASLTGVISDHILGAYSDDTHVVIKAHSFFKKMPLHSGSRFADLMDLKLIGISLSYEYAPRTSDQYKGYDDNGNLVGTDFYGSNTPPVTVIRHRLSSGSGDKEVYLFVPRSFAPPLALGADGDATVRFYIAADFADASSVPVYMEIKKMPAVRVNFEDVDKLQIGTPSAGNSHHMTMGVTLDPDAGFDTGLGIKSIYSFGKWANNPKDQNADLVHIYGTGNYFQPWALPVFRLAGNDSSSSSIVGTSFLMRTSDYKNTSALRWVTGKTKPFCNPQSGTASTQSDTSVGSPDNSKINLGQFFEMDRIDGFQSNGAGNRYVSSNTGTASKIAGISYGRRLGGINYFAKNHTKDHLSGFYDTYPTNADGTANENGEGQNGNRIGLGPTLGAYYTSAPTSPTGAASTGVDLTSNATNGASLLYSPTGPDGLTATQNIYDLGGDAAKMSDINHPAGARCVASYLGCNLYGGDNLSEYITVVKDIKSNFFDQGQDYKAGPPIVVTARQMIFESSTYLRREFDTAAYSMLAGPSLAGDAYFDQYYIPEGTDHYFTRANKYTDDHRGAYTIMWSSYPALTQNSGGFFQAGPTGGTTYPVGEESKKFISTPLDGLELICNWLMGGTGSVGVPLVTPDKTAYYGDSAVKLYPPDVAQALTNLSLHTPNTASDADVTNANHDGKCMSSYTSGGSEFKIRIGQGDYTGGVPLAGTGTSPREQIGIAGYQDVVFIMGMCTTTQSTTAVTSGDVQDWTRNLPWFGADAFMASVPGREYDNHQSLSSTIANDDFAGGPAGTYYRSGDSESGTNAGPQNARLVAYRDQAVDYLFGAVTASFSPVQAYSSTNTTICTDPVRPGGRANYDAGQQSTGLSYTSGGFTYDSGGLNNLATGHSSQNTFTALQSPAGSAQGNCLSAIGTDIIPVEYQVEITDDAGGFGAGAGGEYGFEGLRVKGVFTYGHLGTGSGPDNFATSTGSKTASTVADVTSIWNIKITPGNASNSGGLFDFAQSVSPNDDENDVHYAEIVQPSPGQEIYELRFTFKNTENVIQATEIPQVFPDLPFLRALPLRNDLSGMVQSVATTLGSGNDLSDIIFDAYKSGFFNNQFGNTLTQASHSARLFSYYEAEGGESYDKDSYYPVRCTKLSIKPVSAALADQEYISSFVTYGDFTEQTGCTDPAALNYNPNAVTDDGSCVDVVPGCTNASASNYNPNANQDDGSCLFCESYFSSYTNVITPSNPFNETAISSAVNGTGALTPLASCMGMKFGGWIGGDAGNVGNDFGISNDSLASNLLSTNFQTVFQGSPSETDAPWIHSIQNVGIYIGQDNIPFQAVTTDDIGLSMVLGTPFITALGDDALEVIEDPTAHKLKVYAATESVVSFIMDNNNNTGEGADVTTAKANPFITVTEGGQIGFTYVSGVSFGILEVNGNTPLFSLNSAESVLTVDGNSNVRVPRFKFTGTGAQTGVSLNNSTLYVAEYAFVDPTCTDVTRYTAFYGFFMVGTCGCTVFGNQNAPALYSWQTANVSTLPVAYDTITNCTNNFVEIAPVAGEGDEGTSLCYTPDAELSSCDSLYQQCILNPLTICLEDGVTSLEDPSVIFSNGNYYYSQQTTVTVRVDGIWNPTTNQYQINNYLNYVITPVLDGAPVSDLAQGTAEGAEQVLDNVVIGLTHDFTFGNVSSYSFIITYTNPTADIYSDIVGLGPTCQVQLPTVAVENDCIINVGCTDPDAVNTDLNATFDDGSCQYENCEDIFLENVGGFTGTDITTTNTSSECATIEQTVLGVTTTTSYTQINATGTVNVKVVVDHAIEEFPASQCYIVLTPASTTGIVGVGSTSELVDLIIQNWATTTVDGGQIDLGSGATAEISPLQELDVLFTASANPTDYTNRNYNEDIASEDGYTFENLAQGLYFIFVIPPPDLLDGLTEYYAANCSSQTIFYLDEFTTATVGVDDPTNGPCEEDCGNPAGCQDEVYGCTDPDNEAYDPEATVDDGSCLADPECPPGSTDPACIDCTTEFAIRLIGGGVKRRIDDGAQDPCDPTEEGEGCTDPNACNYDPFIDTSNSNNQLCDYCSCNPGSVDCCEGEDCGCDPEIDEECPPPPPPPCPDPTNPDCNPGPPQPCYDPAECPPPPPPCVILGNCPPPPPPPPPPKPPTIEIINPVSVTCIPDFMGQSGEPDEIWSQVQNAAMLCASNEGAKMVVKMKSGIEFDEEDLIKLDLITYLFNGGADNSQLPCLWNCNYQTKTRFDKYTAKEKWARGGFKKWASTESYKKGTVVAYFYQQRGATYISYFSAMRDIGPKEIHPKYKTSGWKQVVDRKPKTVDPLGIATGNETYLQDFYDYFVRFCTACEVQEAPPAEKKSGTKDERRNNVGINRTNNRPSSQTGIIGPDGEEIIF